jgi:hypothetical protein
MKRMRMILLVGEWPTACEQLAEPCSKSRECAVQ